MSLYKLPYTEKRVWSKAGRCSSYYPTEDPIPIRINICTPYICIAIRTDKENKAINTFYDHSETQFSFFPLALTDRAKIILRICT